MAAEIAAGSGYGAGTEGCRGETYIEVSGRAEAALRRLSAGCVRGGLLLSGKHNLVI